MPSDELDYDALGFKCGIEIHQQLDTEHKLFCGCDTTPADEEAEARVTRELRPVASELGEVDEAAQYEYLKGKQFVYNIYDDTSCLVELDEEPPHPVNREALEIGLEAALLMHCTVPDEIHVMRKTVIDGSNTAGFQRTAVIGMDGYIETEHGEVAIEDMELEEESAGIHERDEDRGVFDLDRLGIPLIEVGTDASIQSPAHAQEVAERLGMLLRSTGKVKRGLGTIRQDVNVSIEQGARVEVKGFQELNLLDELVRNEVRRQKSLVDLQDELDGPMASDIVDVTDVVASTDNDILSRIIESDGAVLAFLLKGLEGHMNEDLCPGLHLGRELADYAQAQGVKGIMHSDEDVSTYGLEDEFEDVANRLGKQDGEVVVLIAEQEDRARQAAEAVIDRAELLPDTIPEETRTADETVTRYARPLPGEARMYPETDIPPIVMERTEVSSLQEELPEPLDEKEARLRDEIGAELASQVVSSPRVHLFERLADEYDVEKRTVANLIVNDLGALESDNSIDASVITDNHLEQVVALVADGTISTGQVQDLLAAIVDAPEAPVKDLADRFAGGDEEEVRAVVNQVLDEKQELIEEQGEHAQGALMGVVMGRLEGADGSTVSRILSEELENRLDR